ncbi:MAG: hypothetical protein KJ667_06510, partial [Alphaproteobacteria bacterium]|nr:hypothetical protein [Alphaproteobacteria bacterium]
MKLLRENFVLVLSISLPLLLMLALFALNALTRATIPPPQHDVIFALPPYGPDSFFVSENKGKMVITYTPSDKDSTGKDEALQLFRYDPRADRTYQFSVSAPANQIGGIKTNIPVPEALQDISVDPAVESSDGYRLTRLPYRNSGLLFDIFINNNRGP